MWIGNLIKRITGNAATASESDGEMSPVPRTLSGVVNLAELRATGIDVVMTTGAGITAAKSVGTKLDIVEIHGEVKPQDQLAMVERPTSMARGFWLLIFGFPATGQSRSLPIS